MLLAGGEKESSRMQEHLLPLQVPLILQEWTRLQPRHALCGQTGRQQLLR